MNNFIEINALTKSYGGVYALTDVSLSLKRGEIHALMGENGAGKSTFIKCLSGAVKPDRGSVTIDGAPLPAGDIRSAEASGIVAIHQESTAFPHLNAVDNIFAGRELRKGIFLDKKGMKNETTALLNRLGEKLDLRCPLEDMPLAQRQMVAIARAISHKSRLLIMDEPTASLSARESSVLFRIIRQLQEEGVTILYISHRLEEVYQIAHNVTVLRDGRHVATHPIAELDRDELVRLMVGRPLIENTEGSPISPGEVVLDVRNLTDKRHYKNISFQLRKGEITGMAGLVGAGRSEVATAIFGIDTPESGAVYINGNELPPGSVNKSIDSGIALVPEDRQHQGLVLPLSVSTNLLLSSLNKLSNHGVRSPKKEAAFVDELIQQLSVKAATPEVPANTLSGGNQQKLAIGKWIATAPQVLLLDEPTRGVDVGAKAEVYRLIRDLAQNGAATLVISSDLPEILALCDRILVMREGEIAGELTRQEASEEKILALALPSSSGETQDENGVKS